MPEREIKPIKPSFIRRDERGTFVEIVNEGPWETIIHGSMKSGAEMGNHYHKECRALFYVVSGKAEVHIRHVYDQGMNKVILGSGEGLYFLPYEIHVIHYLEKTDFIFLKSYRYREDQPDMFPEKIA